MGKYVDVSPYKSVVTERSLPKHIQNKRNNKIQDLLSLRIYCVNRVIQQIITELYLSVDETQAMATSL